MANHSISTQQILQTDELDDDFDINCIFNNPSMNMQENDIAEINL